MPMAAPPPSLHVLRAANSTGWLDPGFTQSAVLPASALRPGQRYVYRVGGEEVGWSTEHSFLAPVGAGWDASSPEPFVFLNFNDVAMSNPVMKASAAGAPRCSRRCGVCARPRAGAHATAPRAGHALQE